MENNGEESDAEPTAPPVQLSTPQVGQVSPKLNQGTLEKTSKQFVRISKYLTVL
jgi:hypothetical protein